MPKITFENGDEYEISQESAEAMAPQKKRREPEVGESFYFIYDSRVHKKTSWIGDNLDYERLAIGNIFRNKKDAKNHLRYLKALTEIKRHIWENGLRGEGVEIVFNRRQREFCPILTEIGGVSASPLPCLKSPQAANQLIKAKEDELRVVFGVDK